MASDLIVDTIPQQGIWLDTNRLAIYSYIVFFAVTDLIYAKHLNSSGVRDYIASLGMVHLEDLADILLPNGKIQL